MPLNPFVAPSGELSNEIQLNIAEILTLKLPEGSERIIASKWMKKFLACDPKVYKHNLSLFITCLTKQMLVKPFNEAPQDMSKEWKNFDRDYSTKDINAAIVHRMYKDSFTPPYQIDISHDMKEYLAYQEIPFFGAHFYFAFSPNDSIDKWNGFNKMNVPKHLVDRLRGDDEIESPIKEGFFPKSKTVESKLNQTGATRKIPKSKPGWQGPIAEESEEEEKRPMVAIPITDRVKNLPPALQRRMLKAEQEKLDKQTRKETEKPQKSVKGLGRTQKSIKMPEKVQKLGKQQDGTQKSLKSSVRFPKAGKRVLKKPNIDDVDAALAAQSERRPRTPKSPEIPDFKGPNAEIQRRLYTFRKSNPPPELIQTTRDMNKVSKSINTEAERLLQEGTPNLDNVEQLHDAGVNIGNRVLRMMKAQQVEEAAVNSCEAVQNVRLTMDQLNQMLNKSIESKEETLMRLAEIKENMRKSAEAAQNLSQKINEQDAVEDLVEAIDKMVEINEKTAERIENVEPKNRDEVVLIEGLVNENRKLAKRLKNQSVKLTEAIEENELNTSSILQNTIHNVDQLLEMSFDQNDEIEDHESQAVQLQHYKNQQLEELQRKAQEIDENIENTFKAAASKPVVAKHLQIPQINIEDEIIDLESADLDFGEIVDDEFMKKQRQERKKYQTLVDFEENENLMDVSGGIMEDLEKSIAIIEDQIIPDLKQYLSVAKNRHEREIIEEAVENVQESLEFLQEQLIELNESESNVTLV